MLLDGLDCPDLGSRKQPSTWVAIDTSGPPSLKSGRNPKSKQRASAKQAGQQRLQLQHGSEAGAQQQGEWQQQQQQPRRQQQMAAETDAAGWRLPPECDEGNVEYKLRLAADHLPAPAAESSACGTRCCVASGCTGKCTGGMGTSNGGAGGPSHRRFQQLATQLQYRLAEGDGVAYYYIGVADDGTPVGLDPSALRRSVDTLHALAAEVSAAALTLRWLPGAPPLHPPPPPPLRTAVLTSAAPLHLAPSPPLPSAPPPTPPSSAPAPASASPPPSSSSTRSSSSSLASCSSLQECHPQQQQQQRQQQQQQQQEQRFSPPQPLPLQQQPSVSMGRRCCALVRVARVSAETASYRDVRVAVAGGVGAGKSTLVGVLTRGVAGAPRLDDGRGSARSAVLCHRHELESGHTSSVSSHVVGYCRRVEDGRTEVLNYGGGAAMAPTLADIASRATQVVRVVDLGGHHRSVRSALGGLTRMPPDCVLLCCSAGEGAGKGAASADHHQQQQHVAQRHEGSAAAQQQQQQRQLHLPPVARLHAAVALALGSPLAVVITKADVAAPNAAVAAGGTHTLDGGGGGVDRCLEAVRDLLAADGTPPCTTLVASEEDAERAALRIAAAQAASPPACACAAGRPPPLEVPVFVTSSVTGQGVAALHAFLRSLPPTAAEGLRRRLLPCATLPSPPSCSPSAASCAAGARSGGVQGAQQGLEDGCGPTIAAAATSPYFQVDGLYRVTGAGCVVSGTVISGRISVGSRLHLGPMGPTATTTTTGGGGGRSSSSGGGSGGNGGGNSMAVVVNSIRRCQVPVRSIEAGQYATLAVEPNAPNDTADNGDDSGGHACQLALLLRAAPRPPPPQALHAAAPPHAGFCPVPMQDGLPLPPPSSAVSSCPVPMQNGLPMPGAAEATAAVGRGAGTRGGLGCSCGGIKCSCYRSGPAAAPEWGWPEGQSEHHHHHHHHHHQQQQQTQQLRGRGGGSGGDRRQRQLAARKGMVLTGHPLPPCSAQVSALVAPVTADGFFSFPFDARTPEAVDGARVAEPLAHSAGTAIGSGIPTIGSASSDSGSGSVGGEALGSAQAAAARSVGGSGQQRRQVLQRVVLHCGGVRQDAEVVAVAAAAYERSCSRCCGAGCDGGNGNNAAAEAAAFHVVRRAASLLRGCGGGGILLGNTAADAAACHPPPCQPQTASDSAAVPPTPPLPHEERPPPQQQQRCAVSLLGTTAAGAGACHPPVLHQEEEQQQQCVISHSLPARRCRCQGQIYREALEASFRFMHRPELLPPGSAVVVTDRSVSRVLAIGLVQGRVRV